MPTVQKNVAPSYPYTAPAAPHKYIAHVAKIKPGKRVMVYKKFIGFKSSKSEAELQNLEKGKNGEYNGFMSPATSRKVRKMLENWLKAIECELTDTWAIDTRKAFTDPANHKRTYPTFVTLTLPARQMHDDNFIKRNLLNRFIINLKLQSGVEHYFWRAEPQKNGNIHFHLLVDRWIHWRSIRHDWNKILAEHGYIEAYKKVQEAKHAKGYTPDRKEYFARLNALREFSQHTKQPFDQKAAGVKVQAAMRKAYEEGVKTGWTDPNSTDIHAIEKVESLTAYVVKYVTKTDGADKVRDLNEDQTEEITTTRVRKIDGRIWGCSDGIRNLNHFEEAIAEEVDFQTVTYDNQAFDFIRHLESEAEKKNDKNEDNGVWRDKESGTVIYELDVEAHIILKALFPELFVKFAQHYKQMYAELYGRKPFTDAEQLLCSIITESVTMFDSSDKTADLSNYVQNTTLTIPDSSCLTLLNLLLFSCSTEIIPVSAPDGMNSEQIEYETETTELDDYADLFSPNELTGARIAADAKAKVTFEYMNNEGEVITREWETITLWYYGATEPTPGANTRYQKPRSIVKHPANNRSYTRKSLLPGWYMIQLDDRSTFQVQKFEAGSDGLYVFNDQGSPGKPLFSGYYSSYGKIKFTFGSVKATKTKPAVSTKAQAFLTLTKNSLDLQFWLYNDRTTGSVTKSLFWFMPAGVYSANWYGIQLQGDSDSQQSTHKSGTIIVAPGKTYPNIKL